VTDDRCPHGDKDWRCPVCCIAEIRRNLPRLERAVAVREKTGDSEGAARFFASRELINVAAYALLQDLNRAGGPTGLEHALNTLRDPARLAEVKREVRQLRSRLALILRDALAPYPLTWDTSSTDHDGRRTVETKPIPCPVVDQDGDCAGPLYVHRDNDPDSDDYGKPAVIRCKHDDDHEWTLAHGGWLKLGVLLGGEIGGVA
jgi:hypothetical protein